MGTGTPAFGGRHNKTHGLCVRCGKHSFHYQKKKCASCGYPSPKTRSYNWSNKAQRRKRMGTGRMRYVKKIAIKLKSGFRTGPQPKKRVTSS